MHPKKMDETIQKLIGQATYIGMKQEMFERSSLETSSNLLCTRHSQYLYLDPAYSNCALYTG
jgi:hypothetical protein